MPWKRLKRSQSNIMRNLIFICVLAFFSCNDKNEILPLTKGQLVSVRTWKFEKALALGNDISSQIPLCYKDNEVKFNIDKTGSISESLVVCSPSSAGNFTWRFSTAEDSLLTSIPIVAGFSGNFKLDSLNTSLLQLSQTILVPPQNIPTPVVLRFK